MSRSNHLGQLGRIPPGRESWVCVSEREERFENLPGGGPVPQALFYIVEEHPRIRSDPSEVRIGQRVAGLMEKSEWLGEELCGACSGSPLAVFVLARVQHDPQGCSEGFGMI
jgi:hypothetical protein